MVHLSTLEKEEGANIRWYFVKFSELLFLKNAIPEKTKTTQCFQMWKVNKIRINFIS